MNALSDTRPATPPGTQAPPRRRAWRLLRWPLLLLALIVALLVGNWWLLVGRWLESTDNAYVQGDIAVLGPRIEGDVAAIRSPTTSAVARRRSADRAGSGRLARPARPGRPPPPPRPRPRSRRRSGRSPSSGPRSRRREAAIVQAQAEQARATADAAPLRVRWWEAAGPRARPTTRRSPTRARPTPRWLPPQAQKAAAEQQLAVLQAQVVQARGAPAERRRRGAAGREQPRLHRDPRAVRRHRRQPRRANSASMSRRPRSSSPSRRCASGSTSCANFKETQLAACSRA